MDNKLQKLLDRYPFFTVLKYGANEEYVCIVQNQNDDVTTIYDFGALVKEEDRKNFLILADSWYWGSNRKTPINIFIGADWGQFKRCAKNLITKEVTVVAGDVVRLENLSEKRTKRRTITLVRKME